MEANKDSVSAFVKSAVARLEKEEARISNLQQHFIVANKSEEESASRVDVFKLILPNSENRNSDEKRLHDIQRRYCNLRTTSSCKGCQSS